FGLTIDKVPSDFLEKMKVFIQHANTFQWPALVLGCASFGIIKLWPRQLQRRVPGSIVALVLGTAAVALFQIPVETIGSKFGGIPHGLPQLQAPQLSWPNIQQLFHPALTIALLAAIESLLCAVVADGMVYELHGPNQEFM